MPEINKCGAGGVLFALVGVILAIFAISLPEFVQVFLITDEDQIGDDRLIAGVGIFNSEYDATTVDPALVAASGIPNEKFSTPSLEFPLLFPAQENFVVDVLPVNSDLAAQLSGSLPGAIVASLTASVKAVEDLEFESCEQYVPAADAATVGVFEELQSTTLPAAVQGITGNVLLNLNDAIQGTDGLVSEDPEKNIAQGFLFTVLNSTVTAVSAETGCETLSLGSAVDALTKQCLSNGLDGAIALNAGKAIITAAITGLKNHFTSAACDTAGEAGAALNVSFCFGAIGFVLGDTSLDTIAAFNPGLSDFCTLLGDTDLCDPSTVLKSDYLKNVIAGLLVEIGTPEALSGAAAVALYLTSALDPRFGGFQITGDAAIGGETAVSPVTNVDANNFPQLFTENYEPCIAVKFIQVATGADLGLDSADAAPDCEFSQYWPSAAKLLQLPPVNDLAATSGLLAELYGRCSVAAEESFGNATSFCPEIFGRTVLGGALSSEAPPLPAAAFESQALADCKDTVTDNEKITTAQALVVISVCCHVLAFLGGVAGVLMEAMPVIYGVSAFTAVAAAVFIISALLTVRSAPVYQNVGEPPAGVVPEPFFKEGSVVIISEIAALMMLISAGCFSAAVYQLMKAEPSDDEDISAAEVKAKDKEEAVPAKAAEEAPEAEETPDAKNSDIVPGTDTSI